MNYMRQNKNCKVLCLLCFLLSLSLSAQRKTFNCKGYETGGRFLPQFLEVELRTVKKDFVRYSIYGYFEKSLEILDKQLAMYGVVAPLREKILFEIKGRANWTKEQLAVIYKTELKNPEYLFIYNHFDICNLALVYPNPVRFPINDIIERYLEEKQAKEVIENLLIDYINSSNVEIYLSYFFCVYQWFNTTIEGYTLIDFEDYKAFLKDYLRKNTVSLSKN